MQFQKKEKRQTTVRFDSHHVRLICWISAIMLSLRLFPVRAKYRWRMEKNSSMAF